MNVSRGNVVIFNMPFTNRPGSKLRPMLVVQSDRNNARMSNTILANISSNTGRSNEPTQVLIDPGGPEGQASGLLTLSVVTCENLFTVEQAQITRRIGQLSAQHLQLVDQALKVSLGLP